MNSRRLTHIVQRGYSLIELMIAIFIGLILVGGIGQIFLANRQAYRAQEGANFMQENGRIAMQILGTAIKQADFWGFREAYEMESWPNQYPRLMYPVSTPAVASPAPSCSLAIAAPYNVSYPLGVYEHNLDIPPQDAGADLGLSMGVRVYRRTNTTFPLTNCGVTASDYAPNTDVLVLKYARPDRVDPAAIVATTYYVRVSPEAFPPPINTGSGIVTVNNGHATKMGVIATGAALATVPVTPPFRSSSVAAGGVAGWSDWGMDTYPYAFEVYYIRRCSVPVAVGGPCSAAADNGRPIPTLYRIFLDGTGVMRQEPVVEGVESINYDYFSDLQEKITLIIPAAGGAPASTTFGYNNTEKVPSLQIPGIVRANWPALPAATFKAVGSACVSNVSPCRMLSPGQVLRPDQWSQISAIGVNLVARTTEPDARFRSAVAGTEFLRRTYNNIFQIRNFTRD
jgi:type IV pilus assembly protein PilW